jgi:hypothetical protein
VTLVNEPVLVTRVVWFDRETGEIRRTLDLDPLLDPWRIGYGGLDLREGGRDFTHTNAIRVRPDGGVLLSLRHQDAMVAVDPEGALSWIAGTPTDWTEEHQALRLAPVGDFPWFYHAHCPLLEPDGQLTLFDNGVSGNFPGETRTYPWASRVVGYQVDEVARTIRQDWAWEPADAPVRSGAEGGVQRLANGNLLVSFGYISHNGTVPLAELGLGDHAVRLVELSPDREVRWQMDLNVAAAVLADGWDTFLALRIPTPW